MSSPLAVSNAPAVLRTMLYGTSTVLFVGNSVSVGWAPRFAQAMRVRLSGFGTAINDSNFSANPHSSFWGGATGNATGANVASILGLGSNYNPFSGTEWQFTGTYTGQGQSAAFTDRLAEYDGVDLNLFPAATRFSMTFNGGDWLRDGAGLTVKTLIRTYANGVTGNVVRGYCRDSANSAAHLGQGSYLQTYSASPGYLVDSYAATAPTAAGDFFVGLQLNPAGVGTTTTGLAACGYLVSNGTAGMTIVNMSIGGTQTSFYASLANISAAAWAAVNSLAAPTHVIVSLNTNGVNLLSECNAIVSNIRTAMPNAHIIFMPEVNSIDGVGGGANEAANADLWYQVYGV